MMPPRWPASEVALEAQLATKGERELTLLLQSNEARVVRSAASLLVKRNLDAIRGVCERGLRGDRYGDEAEDLAQHTALRFYMTLIGGEPVRSPRGLAVDIARKAVASFYRSSARRVEPRDIRPIEDPDPAADPCDIVLAKLELLRIVAAVGARYGLILCDSILERPSDETAERLGTTRVAVDTDRYRMRGRAQKKVEP